MPKVLIIDDEPDMRAAIRHSLGRFPDWEVLEAPNGPAGVALARHERPDLVLLDVRMPVTDGPATLRLLRMLPGGTGIPVVFVTAEAQRTDIARLRELGTAGVLAKPFDPVDLPQEIQHLLAGEIRQAQ